MQRPIVDVGGKIADHDVASALMVVEIGIAKLRHLFKNKPDGADGQVVDPRIGRLAEGLEAEMGRIRRFCTAASGGAPACDVPETVRPLIEMRQALGQLVHAELPAGPAVAVSADDLARVMTNLLDNCARHAARAPVTCSGTISGRFYHLSVSDEGPGFDDELRETAFEPGASSRRGGGFGLCSVRSIVESCGGSVTVDLSGSGTTLRVALPLAVPQAQSTRQGTINECVSR